ncbi:MAG: ABC transporter permease [Clostridia bacterium]|nr:ABC transporter permease [Clostridia bacterium]
MTQPDPLPRSGPGRDRPPAGHAAQADVLGGWRARLAAWGPPVRRLLRHRGALAGLVIVALFVGVAVFAPWLTHYDPRNGVLTERLQPPSPQHILGTDYNGRDMFARLVYGARLSLEVGLVTVGLALVVGTVWGAVSGYVGGWFDLVSMRVVDVMLAFPSLLLAILMIAILGPSLMNAMLAVGIVAIPNYVRLVRSVVLGVKESEFVEAARAEGASHLSVLLRHILPNAMAPVLVQATLGIATAILETAGLSFLGLGADARTPEWGSMLAHSKEYFRSASWTMTYPGLAIMIVVLGFNLLGDGLRDALDPKLKR